MTDLQHALSDSRVHPAPRSMTSPAAVKPFGYRGVLLLCGVWGIIGTLSYARHHLQDPAGVLGRTFLPEYLAALTCFLAWVPLSLLVVRLERRFPLGRPGWPRHLLALSLISIPMVHAASWLTTIEALAVQKVFSHPLALSPLWPVPVRDLVGHQFLYWPSVVVSWMLRTVLEARDNERRASRLMLENSRLETSLRQAELDALRMRLHPHFLFNSLQNISVLTAHDPATASRMLTRLGDLLRASLNGIGQQESTLQDEIALTNAYLAIEQMRFGDRLTSHVTLAPGTERALVPRLLLQPLVENAIRHGLDGVRDRGIIAISSGVEDGALVLSVTDNGAGPPAEPLAGGTGIGLGATCDRLARMYPGRHSFSMRALPEGGTAIRIVLPLTVEPAGAGAHANAATVDR